MLDDGPSGNMLPLLWLCAAGAVAASCGDN
jgi:hypothetical protein